MRVKKLRDVKTPTRGTTKSAGIDFYVPNDFGTKGLAPNMSIVIPSGIVADVPEGYALIAFNKSGVAVKKGLQVGACVVDEDYQGEIHINLTNIGSNYAKIEAGEKIVQFILLPIFYDAIEVVSEDEQLFESTTERGAGWKGSTGTK